jgi:hypothetical protein
MNTRIIAFQKNISTFVIKCRPLTIQRRKEIEPYYRNKRSEACGDGGVSYL